MKLYRYIYQIIIIGSAFVFCACNAANNEKIDSSVVNIPVSADSTQKQGKMPKITFEQTSHDFGTLMQGEKVSFTYKFKNTGNATLIISGVIPSCGCTVAQFTQTPIPPGQSGTVSINFNTETKNGMVKSGVVVQANTYPSETKLSFTAIVNK